MAIIKPSGYSNGRWRKYQSGDIINGPGAIAVTQSSHGFVLGDALRHNGTTWVKAQANSDQTLADGIVVTVIDTNNFVLSDRGFYNLPTHGLGTTGHYYFLSAATAGAVTGDQPSEYVQPLFRVLDANNIHVICDTGYLAASGGTSGGGSFPVTQHGRYSNGLKGTTFVDIIRFPTAIGTPSTNDVSHDAVNVTTNGSIFTVVNSGWFYIETVLTLSSADCFVSICAHGTVTNDPAGKIIGTNHLQTSTKSVQTTAFRYLVANTKIWVTLTPTRNISDLGASNEYFNRILISRLS